MQYQEIDVHGKCIRGFLHGKLGNDIVLLFHGFTGNKVDHHFMVRQFAEAIAACGMMAYRFDFLGSGDSDGTFYEEESILSQIKQANEVAQYFRRQEKKVHLFGFSLGGVIASHLSTRVPIESMFLLSPAGNFPQILMAMIREGQPTAKGYDSNGFAISCKFVEEAMNFPYQIGLCDLMVPVKIVQGSKDQYVTMDSLMQYQRCYSNSEYVCIEGADHCYTTLAHTAKVRKEIKDFYGKIKNMAIKE